jgi:hypothetical protein
MENKNETDKFVKMLFQLLKKRWFDAVKKGENPEESAKDLEEVVKNSKDIYSAMISLSLKYLKDILEPIIKINNDRWKLVTSNKEFKKDIGLLREKVPHLDPKEDIIVCESPDSKVIYDESKWLHSQSQEFNDEFYKGIVAVLSKFNLHYSFYNKLEKYILYPSFDKKVPVPAMNVSDWSPFDKNRELTTAEKRLFKGVLQRKFGVKKGRLPRDKKERAEIKIAKQKINKILSCVSKSQARRKRVIDEALRAVRARKRIKRYYDEEQKRWINNPRLTDADLVDKLSEKKEGDISKEQTRKGVISFRKRRERYKKYIAQYPKNKYKK